MAYTPVDLVIDTWAAPVEIAGTDKIADLDDAINTIMSNDPASLHTYMNAEMAKIPAYLTSELTKVSAETTDAADAAAASAAAALVSENAAAASEAAVDSAVESGTYTPTVSASLGFTSITNIDVSSYIRVGSIVNMNGSFDFAWDGSTTNVYIDLSPPIASAFTNNDEGFGCCVLSDESTRSVISGFANDAARIVFNIPPSSGTAYFTFQYRII